MSSNQKIILGAVVIVTVILVALQFNFSDSDKPALNDQKKAATASTNSGKIKKAGKMGASGEQNGNRLLDQLNKETKSSEHPEIQTMLQTFLSTSSNKERTQALRELAAYIAEHDPSQALDVFESIADQPTGRAKTESYLFSRTFLTHFTPENPASATEWAMSLPEDLRLAAMQSTAPAWAKSDMNGFIDWLDKLDNPALRSAALKDVSMTMAQSDQTEAQRAWVEHAIQMPEAESQAASIVSLWAELDTKEAYHWIEKIKDPLQQDQALVAMADSIAKSDPKLASEWVVQFPKGAARDQAVAATAQKWINEDPAAVAEWLGSFENGQYMKSVSTTIYSAWRQKEPEKADAWLQEQDMDASIKEYMLNMYKKTPPLPGMGENP